MEKTLLTAESLEAAANKWNNGGICSFVELKQARVYFNQMENRPQVVAITRMLNLRKAAK